MSQLTTHILDTTKGKPANGVTIILFRWYNDQWAEMTRDITNPDGCIPHLLKKEVLLEYGTYKMHFETKTYFDQQGVASFYPYVEIVFDITSKEHYHIPLLLTPFGYSTYRGS
jgi:5-hydroxyisourate hydrolase